MMQPQFSGDDVAKLKALLDGINSAGVPDEHIQLLNALEPFLSTDQKSRLATARALVKFLKGRDEYGV